MKKLLAVLLVILFAVPAFAVDVCLEWNPNSEPDLAGYRIFMRTGASYDYTNSDWEGTDTTCTIFGLSEGVTYHFVARAYDTEVLESTDSNEVQFFQDFPWVNEPPDAVQGLSVVECP